MSGLFFLVLIFLLRYSFLSSFDFCRTLLSSFHSVVRQFLRHNFFIETCVSSVFESYFVIFFFVLHSYLGVVGVFVFLCLSSFWLDPVFFSIFVLVCLRVFRILRVLVVFVMDTVLSIRTFDFCCWCLFDTYVVLFYWCNFPSYSVQCVDYLIVMICFIIVHMLCFSYAL